MICLILGTRPEIIKMYPVIKECNKQNLEYFIIHTNQHYSENMDAIIFRDLGLKKAEYNLMVGSGIHGLQTGRMLGKIEEILIQRKPSIVLVQGDTNTTFAGALVASKLGVKIGHIEAGLRSHDKSMPEEINRVLTDHISDYCFSPTNYAKKNLLDEGIPSNKIFVTGNTVVDVVLKYLNIAKKSPILDSLGVKKKEFILVTVHRQENVDNKEKLQSIIKALTCITKKYGMPIIYPVHPRTKKMIDAFKISAGHIITTEPTGFFNFFNLESNARLILTDSGGVQEESCILNVPCVTLRDNTERQETVQIGANIIAGTKEDGIIRATEIMLNNKTKWKNPFGEGKAGGNIVSVLKKSLF